MQISEPGPTWKFHDKWFRLVGSTEKNFFYLLFSILNNNSFAYSVPSFNVEHFNMQDVIFSNLKIISVLVQELAQMVQNNEVLIDKSCSVRFFSVPFHMLHFFLVSPCMLSILWCFLPVHTLYFFFTNNCPCNWFRYMEIYNWGIVFSSIFTRKLPVWIFFPTSFLEYNCKPLIAD